MKFAKATRAVLRFIASLHQKAVQFDCERVENEADRKFTRAAYQLELVNAAKYQLGVMQEQALQAREESHKAWSLAASELSDLKSGINGRG